MTTSRRGLAAKQADRWRRAQVRDTEARYRHQYRDYRQRWVGSWLVLTLPEVGATA